MLAKWIGLENADRPLTEHIPELSRLPTKQELKDGLNRHPLIRIEQTSINASQQGVALAREAYKPSMMFDVTYGQREGRPDFLSGMVVMDVPLFKEKRQDRKLKASQHRLNAAKSKRDDRYIELSKMLDSSYAQWERLGERIQLFDEKLLPQVKQNTEISLSAYQNDISDFTSLMRAQITELETRLKALRLRVDRAKAQARLLYIAGDKS
jgi:outer membrane protein TolC